MNGHRVKTNKTEILIVGAGPLGWACAQFLAQHHIRTIVIDPLATDNTPQWLTRGLGVFWPSLNDPPTRAVVAHGQAMANALQDFCRMGLNHLTDFLPAAGLLKIDCLRLALLPHEKIELDKAVEHNLGITPLTEKHQNKNFARYSENAPGYIWNSHSQKIRKIEKEAKKYVAYRSARVTRIIDTHQSCTAYLDNNEIIHSEMAILANGFHIAQLQPWLSEMLIPMSDIVGHWSTNLPCAPDDLPLAIRTSSGHVAAVFAPQVDENHQWTWELRMTGPRFFLPSAGAGVDLSHTLVDSSLILNIESWLRGQLCPAVQSVLSPRSHADIECKLKSAHFGVDCLPCDELPMLGELGHHGRLLGSTGWLGCGWSASFQAASVLCDLIVKGQSPAMIPLLRPRRWQSGLMEDGVTGMT